MLRHIAAAVVVVCVSPVPGFAQDAMFTVTAASADVYQAPSTGSPVIGRAVRGTAHPVTRELGSWVRISWPAAADGVGFLHITMGRVANGATPQEVRAVAGDAVRALPDAAATPSNSAGTVDRSINARRPAYVTPVPHVFGVGGSLVTGSPLGYGLTARTWRMNRLGVRLDISRHAIDSTSTTRVSSTQLEPSVLFALTDHVSNYFWLRPYVGTGVSFRHQTLRSSLAEAGLSTSDNSMGFQAFVGSEMTVASAPQFALSADVGYRSQRSAFGAFEVGGFDVTMAAHWYIR
jgi:opacity protein-like surface antigen